MANEKNLMPIEELNARFTREERRENAQKANAESQRTRRRRKAIREIITDLMYKPCTQEDVRERLAEFGIEGEESVYAVAMVASLIGNVLDKGDVNSFKALMEYAGLNPDQKLKDEERKARIRQMERGEDTDDGKLDELLRAIERHGEDANA